VYSGAGRIDKRMDGEADREKIKLFLSYFCKRTVFFLKKCVLLQSIKKNAFFYKKRYFTTKV